MVGIDLENYDVLLTTLHCRVDIWTSGKKIRAMPVPSVGDFTVGQDNGIPKC